jgi:hypothetical protein
MENNTAHINAVICGSISWPNMYKSWQGKVPSVWWTFSLYIPVNQIKLTHNVHNLHIWETNWQTKSFIQNLLYKLDKFVAYIN